MPIQFENKSITNIKVKEGNVSEVYYEDKLVYSATNWRSIGRGIEGDDRWNKLYPFDNDKVMLYNGKDSIYYVDLENIKKENSYDKHTYDDFYFNSINKDIILGNLYNDKTISYIENLDFSTIKKSNKISNGQGNWSFDIDKMTYGNGYYAIADSYYNSNSPVDNRICIYYSRDKINWSRSFIGSNKSVSPYNLLFGNNKFICSGIGFNGNYDLNIAYSNNTPTNWNIIANSDIDETEPMFFCNGYFFAQNWIGSFIYKSSDGSHWSSFSLPNNSSFSNILYYKNKYYIISKEKILTTSDFNSFIACKLPETKVDYTSIILKDSLILVTKKNPMSVYISNINKLQPL